MLRLYEGRIKRSIFSHVTEVNLCKEGGQSKLKTALRALAPSCDKTLFRKQLKKKYVAEPERYMRLSLCRCPLLCI